MFLKAKKVDRSQRSLLREGSPRKQRDNALFVMLLLRLIKNNLGSNTVLNLRGHSTKTKNSIFQRDSLYKAQKIRQNYLKLRVRKSKYGLPW
jgi:hypothetical protein